MSDLELRPAVDEDHDDLLNLFACCYGEEVEAVFDARRDFPYLKGVRTYYTDGGGGALVAENHLGIVGLVCWLPFEIDHDLADKGLSEGMLLNHLLVHPLVRRQRLGTELMFGAIDAADEADCPFLACWLNIKFHRGHKFLRYFTFDMESETRIAEDVQRSSERLYSLDVEEFLEALDEDPEFYDSFFAPSPDRLRDNDHDDIDDPSQFVVDDSESWR